MKKNGDVLGRENINNEESLKQLGNIFEYSTECFYELMEYALKQMIELTKSQYGWINQYAEEENVFISSICIKETAKDERRQNKTYRLEPEGVWKEAIRHRQPIIRNNLNDQLLKELPQVCNGINSLMVLPVLKEEKIIGLVGLANKNGGYDKIDSLHTDLLMKAVFNVIEVKKTEDQLRQLSTRLELATRAAGIGIWDLEFESDTFWFDDQMKKLYNMEEGSGYVSHQVWRTYIYPEDLEISDQKLEMAMNDANAYEHEFRIRWKDGSLHDIRALAAMLWDNKGKPLRIIGTNWEITKEKEMLRKLQETNDQLHKEIRERKKTEEALRSSEEKFRTIVNTSPDGIIISDMDGKIKFVTSKALSIWGYESADEVLGRNILEFVEESEREEVKCRTQKLKQGKSISVDEVRMVKKDGSIFYSEAKARVLLDKNKNPEGILYVERDVSQRRQMEDKMKELVCRDQLTGLFNRRKIDQVLNAAENNQRLSIILLDIDFFKEVNDIYGHQTGDKVLITAGQMLKEGIRKTDVLGRWGGEEFIVICLDTDLAEAAALAEKLRVKIRKTDFGRIGRKTASFGVAQLKEEETLDELITRCDQALYKAKELGRDQVVTEQKFTDKINRD